MRRPPHHVLNAAAQPNARWDVLAFIGSLDVGGCERHLATVYPQLAAGGLKVGIVTFRPGGVLEHEVRARGVDVLNLARRPRRKIKFLNTIRDVIAVMLTIADISRLFRSNRVGVAHFFLPGAYIHGGLGAFFARFQACVMSRRSLNNYQAGHPWATRIERFLHPRMHLLTANARPALSQLLGEGAPEDRTFLLHSGVNLAPLEAAPHREAAREQFALSPDTLAIAIVANVIPYKGHADLIEALGRIAPRIAALKWTLLVAGRDDGPVQALREKATALGITDNVRWLGLISDVPTLWRAADIGVLASHQEGLPNSLLEGMAMAVPMVATEVGGVADIATDGVDALLVPPRNPEALSAALLRLMDDRALRGRLGRAAAARVREAFSLDTCVGRYRRLYDLMLQRPALRGADIVASLQSVPLDSPAITRRAS